MWCRGVFFPQCSKRYLSYILIAFFDVLCSTNDELMNVVYFCFLSWRIRWTISLCTTMHRALNRVPVWNRRNPAHLLQDFLSKDFLKSWDLYHLPFDLPGGYKHWHEASNENNVASIYKPFQMMLGEHLVFSDFFYHKCFRSISFSFISHQRTNLQTLKSLGNFNPVLINI